MKKLILFLVLFSSAFYLSVRSQGSLSLQYIGGPIEPNSTVLIIGDPSDEPIKIDIQVTNHSSVALNVKVKKTIHAGDTLTGTTNTFCWGVCYPPNIYISPYSRTIEAGATSDDFDGDYSPLGIIGMSTIMYTFFIEETPTDSVAVIVEFKASPTAVQEELLDKITFSNAYPNPSAEQVSFDYNLPEEISQAQLSISSILGAQVKQVTVTSSGNTVRIPVYDLQEGVYFYTLKADGKNLVTRKMIIQR
jgi:hypothetical protein